MNKILSVIVTYNPEINRLKQNLENIINQVDEVIIIDNNSDNIGLIQELTDYFRSNQYMLNIIVC